MADINHDDKPDGAAFDDYFESLGKKAENLSVHDQLEKTAAPNSTSDVAPQLADVNAAAENGDDQRVVDEIESLCMNCHENVSTDHSLWTLDLF